MKPFRLIDNPAAIDKAFIQSELNAGKEVHVQFSEKVYTDKMLADLNELCLQNDENLAVRFYGHYSDIFDCNTVLKIPNVKCLYVNSLQDAHNVEALTRLTSLIRLDLQVFELGVTELLNAADFKKLNKLTIGETRTKAMNLEYLRDYQNLTALTISGHTKNIDAIGAIAGLESLILHSIKKAPVAFINQLKKLQTLRFLLGSRDNIREIEENTIEHLEIMWVRGFNDLSNIDTFKKLKTLQLEDLAQLTGIHFAGNLPGLTALKVSNCKILNTITGLGNLSSLGTLLINKTSIDFNDFMKQGLPIRLQNFSFYTGKVKADEGIQAILTQKGYS